MWSRLSFGKGTFAMYINHCSGWCHQTQAVLFNPLTDGSSEAEEAEKASNQLHPQQPGRTVAEPPPRQLPPS